MLPSLDDFNRLVAALYHGHQEDAPWENFLEQLCAMSAARLTVLGFTRPRPGDPGVLFIGGMQFDAANQRQYADRFGAFDPFVNLPDRQAVTLEEMLPLTQLRETVYYQEFMQPYDCVQVLGVDVQRQGRTGAFLRALRGEQEAPFNDHDKALFNLLVSHLPQLLDLLDHDTHHAFESRLYNDIAQRLEMGTILLDAEQRIVHSNPVARHLLEQGLGLRERNHTLVATHPGDNRRLQALLRQYQGDTPNQPAITSAMPLTGDDPAARRMLLIKPLTSAAGIILPATPQGSDRRPTLAIYISTPENLSGEQQGLLQQLFDFTPSEARLAIALANGRSLEEIAEDLSVSRNTLRTHLRGAFQKTGVNQQSALVSLVLRSVAGLG
ncbi:helix-turn-helix transcriptional regulator [Parahaliea mediterranea]|uniref:helix-turn-helix transcriptional regulator n=1 Tax=Parahaliea mediterranea TaxID=651086 RepID=UPI000E2F7EE0|nr:helix-turn-helix transcriptional regulator [Parahaliea mediterranea]